MSNKNNDGRASLRDPKQQSNEYYEPIKGMPGKFRDLDMINDDGMKVIKKIDSTSQILFDHCSCWPADTLMWYRRDREAGLVLQRELYEDLDHLRRA